MWEFSEAQFQVSENFFLILFLIAFEYSISFFRNRNLFWSGQCWGCVCSPGPHRSPSFLGTSHTRWLCRTTSTQTGGQWPAFPDSGDPCTPPKRLQLDKTVKNLSFTDLIPSFNALQLWFHICRVMATYFSFIKNER